MAEFSPCALCRSPHDCSESVCAWEMDQANRYADAMTRRDLAQRHTGTPEQDQDLCGRPLLAGS